MGPARSDSRPGTLPFRDGGRPGGAPRGDAGVLRFYLGYAGGGRSSWSGSWPRGLALHRGSAAAGARGAADDALGRHPAQMGVDPAMLQARRREWTWSQLMLDRELREAHQGRPPRGRRGGQDLTGTGDHFEARVVTSPSRESRCSTSTRRCTARSKTSSTRRLACAGAKDLHPRAVEAAPEPPKDFLMTPELKTRHRS